MADVTEYERAFGRHVRSLRKARGWTQDELAKRSTLSPDTIRRIEAGSFSPSLTTLRKLCYGLDLPLSTLFETFELGDASPTLLEAIRSLSDRDRLLALRLCSAMVELRRAGV